MRKYTVTIESAESYPRTYNTTSRDVLKLAAQYGRCESGETVTVYNMRGELRCTRRKSARITAARRDDNAQSAVCFVLPAAPG